MVTIPAQFNGPARSGNGGYVAGMLAAELGGDVVTSTLRLPPPLDVPLAWERHDAGEPVSAALRLVTAGGAIVAEAAPGSFLREPPACPTADEARAGREQYPGFHHHPFSRCFTCGPDRAPGDGLRLFSGPVDPADTALTAADWALHEAFAVEDGAASTPVTWAALDCPGGWAADFVRHTTVLGRMTAEVRRRPLAGEPCRAVGRLDRRDGRKFFTDTALYTAEGELLGRAEQIWFLVDPAALG